MRQDPVYWLVVVLPILDWIAAGVLIALASRKPYIVALTERAIVAVVLAVLTTGLAFIVVNSSVDEPVLTMGSAIDLLELLAVGASIPAGYWLALFALARLRDGGGS